MWFWLSLIALLCWSGSDLFSKIGCQGEDDHLAHLKMVIAVGTVMGLHAAFEIFVGGTEISWSIIWTYLPVSLLYIGSMTLGYLCLRYIEGSANCAYELTFLFAAVLCFIYVVFIKKDRLLPKREAPKYIGAICETAGQFAYIYAIADTSHLAMSAPIISSYCAASVLWSRLFLKEKLSWKHYAMILLVVIGIAVMGVFDI